MGHRKFHPQILVDMANDEPAHLTFPANFEILRLLAQAGVGLPSKQHICPFRTAGSHHSYSSLLSLLLGVSFVTFASTHIEDLLQVYYYYYYYYYLYI